MLTGRPLRYTLTLVLRRAPAPMTVAELVAGLVAAGEATGVPIAGRPSKAVSDALRWEIRKGRVVRVRHSLHAYGTMPRSTVSWMRSYVLDRA